MDHPLAPHLARLKELGCDDDTSVWSHLSRGRDEFTVFLGPHRHQLCDYSWAEMERRVAAWVKSNSLNLENMT